jgi:hypothetical protein
MPQPVVASGSWSPRVIKPTIKSIGYPAKTHIMTRDGTFQRSYCKLLSTLLALATQQQPRQRIMSRAPSKTPSYGSIDPGERWDNEHMVNEGTTPISTTPMPSYPSSLSARFGFQKRINLYLCMFTPRIRGDIH